MATLKDLLPGIIGLAAGSASPRLGQAGARTLGTVDAIQQRNRRQTLEDERMDMSRASAERAEEASFRADENFAYLERQRQDVSHEQSLAQNAASQILKRHEGIDLPPRYTEALMGARTRAEVGQIGERIHKFVSDTPMNPEAVEKYRLTLKPGEYAYVTERQPDTGTLIRRTIRGEGEIGTSMKGFMPALNAGQAVQRAGMTLEHSREKYQEEGVSQFAKAREDTLGKDAPIRWDDPGAASKLLRSETTLDLGAEERGIEQAQLGLQGAEQDFSARAMQLPRELLMALIQRLSGHMNDGLNLAPQAAPQAAAEQPQMGPGTAAAQPYLRKKEK